MIDINGSVSEATIEKMAAIEGVLNVRLLPSVQG